MAARKLMIIDTDVSTSGALALMLALKASDCEILAITVAPARWDHLRSYDNLQRILQYFGTPEIPVYSPWEHFRVGLDSTEPYSDEMFVTAFPGNQLPPHANFITTNRELAHHALVRLAEEYKGQVSMVTLGPLTNVAMAHFNCPSFSKNLKMLYISAGEHRKLQMEDQPSRFQNFISHSNFYNDTYGANHVLNEFACPISILTSNVVDKHRVPWSWFKRWTIGPSRDAQFIRCCTMALSEKFMNETINAKFKMGFRDCALLTMTAMIHPWVVTECVTRSVLVSSGNPQTLGMLCQRETDDVQCSFCTKFNLAQVKEIWMAMLT